ncbi:squalene synthase HpnC [Gimesia sp.]|uniref:squalene synthase HpnC n=1 Tax=Gimesia sp. TaxID=2024833 RepID=UPI000C4D4CA5|nr:squalene synthase HpnC [Gimesia sp.]MAX36109.1 squalene synthase HpnC [Gimesia sp.]HBL45203.1 squalene synthase HpnC [Planctomycetaceae bacterium]|tara:strand:- start:6895 stop:7866 length:972 start_codon:yes stop_codon:yes gene_type:complete
MTAFEHELAAWGPDSPCFQGTDAPVSLAEAQAYCRKIALGHYENFPVVSWALPRELRPHFYHIYAFCRWADDLGDEIEDADQSLNLLAWWRSQLVKCYQSIQNAAEDAQPSSTSCLHPVFIALAPTIVKYDLPQSAFDDLIQAFEQDQRISEYQTFAELLSYCQRSANPVGRLVLHLCESVTEETLAWSDSICTGLQLANFWQDVARDFAIGRIYLPREDCEQFGYTREQIERNEFNESFQKLMAFEVQRARQYLLEGVPLIAQLPGRLQVDIDLFIRGGLKILDHIERQQFNVWKQRPQVTRFEFGIMLCQSLMRRITGRNR